MMSVYPRVLDLHRDRPPVGEDAAVHLPDRGGGDGLRLELRDRVAPAGEFRVELALHDAERDRRRLPLQRASTPVTSGGSSESCRLSIWPTFIAAPFSWPSSRTMRSALRTRFASWCAWRDGPESTSETNCSTATDAPTRPTRLPRRSSRASGELAGTLFAGRSALFGSEL